MRRAPFLLNDARDERRLEIDGATAVADMFLPAMAGPAILMPGARRASARARLQVIRNPRRARPY